MAPEEFFLSVESLNSEFMSYILHLLPLFFILYLHMWIRIHKALVLLLLLLLLVLVVVPVIVLVRLWAASAPATLTEGNCLKLFSYV